MICSYHYLVIGEIVSENIDRISSDLTYMLYELKILNWDDGYAMSTKLMKYWD